MNRQKIIKRTQIITSVFVVIIMIFCGYVMKCSSSFAGFNAKTDELRKSTTNKLVRSSTIEGSIYDCNDVILSEGMEPGKSGVLVYPEEYSWLLGYTFGDYSQGLKGRFEEYLYRAGKEDKGANLHLTLDHELQTLAYKEIAGFDASAVIMDVHTGKILALASSKETDEPYNVNEYHEHYEYWSSLADDFFQTNGIKDAAEPGSVFKLVTASAMIENGNEDDIINDKGTAKIGEGVVSNNGKRARGKIGLQGALGYSSNIYFAKEAVKMGGPVIREQAEKYLIGQDIELDFTRLTSNFDLENYREETVAATGYGQGNTLMTPLHIAMVAQAIANNGTMLKPYLVEKITQDGKNLLNGGKKELAQPVTKETAKKLKKLLNNVATDYYSIDSVPGLCTKTGTSQISGGKYKCYFLGFTDDYVVLVSKVTEDTKEYGRDLQNYVLDIFKYLKKK